jgi:tetratricopeptide (TPR) repeat protein
MKLYIATTCLIMLLFFPLAAFAEDEPKLSRAAQQALYNAQQALEKEQLPQAVAGLREYMSKAAADGEQVPEVAYLMLGNTLYNMGKIKDAVRVFVDGVSAFSNDASLRLNLAVARYDAEDLATAALDFRKAFALYKAEGDVRPKLLHHAAVSHYQAEKLKAAKKDMQDLWALKPVKVEKAWTDLWIQVLCALEDWPQAEKAVMQYLRKNKSDAAFWKLLAQIRANRSRYEQAISAFEVAHALKPLGASELHVLADLYFYLDAPLSGIRVLQEIEGHKMSVKELDDLARSYERALMWDKAVEFARKALEAEPTSARVLALGRIFSEAGRHEELIALCRDRVRKDAANGEMLVLAGLSAHEMRQTQTAKAFFRRALQDKSSEQQAMAWLNVLQELETARREAQVAELEAPSAEGEADSEK